MNQYAKIYNLKEEIKMRTLRTGHPYVFNGCRRQQLYRRKSVNYRLKYGNGCIIKLYRDFMRAIVICITITSLGTMMLVTSADDATTIKNNHGGNAMVTDASFINRPVVLSRLPSTAMSVGIVTTEFTKSRLIESEPIEVVEEEIDPITTLNNNLGDQSIDIGDNTLKRYDLPNSYYPGIDFSSFQPYMDYRCITNISSPAYKVSHSNMAYTDEHGMRRYKTTSDQFTIDGKDDYVIALGTYYKEKGVAGTRYLIVTTTGMYTAITGDEKSDSHTDSRHMFSLHRDGTGGIIEWIVDQRTLDRAMRLSGTITSGPIEPLQGEILHIYGIE